MRTWGLATAIGGFVVQIPLYSRQPLSTKMTMKEKSACTDVCCNKEGDQHRASPSRQKELLLRVPARPPPPIADATSVKSVDKIEELNAILHEDVQLAVWRQSSLPNFVKELSDEYIEPQDLPSFDGVIPTYPGMVAEVLKKYLYVPYPLRSHEGRKRVLDEDGMDELVQHIDNLAQAFASIVKQSGLVCESEDEVPFVNVRLSVVGDDGCRFWHQDYVPFRLCTTFRGPSTEWVLPSHSKTTLENRELDSDHAQSLTHYDVALFKGRGADSGNEEDLYDHPGIVHRSPRTSGVHRVLVVIDLPQEGWHF